jgi:ABC-type multidrug transport system fused ATPase/permease subunit
MIEKIKALFTLVGYCLQRFPLFYGCLLTSFLTVLLELAAMVSLFPLAEYAAGHPIADTSRWATLLAAFGAKPEIRVFILLFLILLVIRTVSQLTAALLTSLFFRKLIAHLSSTAFTVFVTKLSFADIQKKSIGYYLNLAGEEANRASQIINGIVRLVPAAFLALLYFGLIASQSLQIAIGVLVFLLVSVMLLRGSFRRSHELGGRQQTESRALNSHFIESLSALRSVKAFTAEYFVARRYQTMISAYAKTCFKIDSINSLSRYTPALILTAFVGGWTLLALDEAYLSAHFPFMLVLTVLLMRFFPIAGQSLDIFLKIVADLGSGKEIVDVVRRIDVLRLTT